MNPIKIKSRYGTDRTIELIDRKHGVFRIYGKSEFTHGSEGMFDFEGGPMLLVGEDFYGFGNIKALFQAWTTEDAYEVVALDVELDASILVEVEVNKKTLAKWKKEDKESDPNDLISERYKNALGKLADD